MLSGSGIQNDPYLIHNVSDWIELNSYQSQRNYFKLMDDIDFNGQIIVPINNFIGYLDGNYKRIKYFKIENDADSCGLFSSINGDYVNHSIKNLEIYSGSLSYSYGITNFGFVAGIINSASISNVHVVQCKDFDVGGGMSIHSEFNLGFFVGKTIDSIIVSSSVRNIEFNMDNIINYDGNLSIGGFVGNVDDSTINTCYADDKFYNIITSTYTNLNLGGFLGYVTGSTTEVFNCHTSASIHMIYWDSTTKVGGFVGNVQEMELFENCYANTYITTDAYPISYVNGFVGYSTLDNYNNCFYNMDRVPGGFNTSYVEISGRSDKQSNSIVRLPDSEMKFLENYTEIDNYYLIFAENQTLGFIQQGMLIDPYFDGDNLDGWLLDSDPKVTFQYVEPGTSGNYCLNFQPGSSNVGIYLDLNATMIPGEYYIVKMRYKSTIHFNVEDYNGVVYKSFTPKGDWTYVEFKFLATSTKKVHINFLESGYTWIDSFYLERDSKVDINSVEIIDSNVYNKVLELDGNTEYLYSEEQVNLSGFDIAGLTGTQLPPTYSLNSAATSLILTNELGSNKCVRVITTGSPTGLRFDNPLASYKSYKIKVRYKSSVSIGFNQWNVNSQLFYTMPATTEWNEVKFTITTGNTAGSVLYFRVSSVGTFYIDSFEIYEDVKNELNSHTELVKHSKNRTFETAINTNTVTNSGYGSSTDWVDTNNDGLADTYSDQYMLDFDGVDDYLQISTPVDISGFNPASANGGWSNYYADTITPNITSEVGSTLCLKIETGATGGGISKSGLEDGKKYKITMRYKSNSDISFGYSGSSSGYGVKGKATTQWNTIELTLTSIGTFLYIRTNATSVFYIEYITIRLDWQLDLNESYELINHSINRDFELITSASASVTPLNEYAIQFNGSDEYLYRSLPDNMLTNGTFNSGTNTDSLSSEGLATDFANLEFGRTGTYCLKITGNTSSSYKKIYKSILTVGKKYKAKLRYKSNIATFVGSVDGEIYFPATTQWNIVEYAFVATTEYFRIGFYGDTTHYVFIDDIEVRLDWKLDLNESYELIKHSMNRDFELAYSASAITNTGYTETTDWTNADTYGVASGITPREDYAIEFDGSTEYLGIPLPPDLAVFTPSSIAGGNPPTGWSKHGVVTVSYVTTESGSVGCMKLESSGADIRGIAKTTLLTVGKNYKFSIKYKSTVNVYVGNNYSNTFKIIPATSEWNTVSFVASPYENQYFLIGIFGIGILWLESITIKEDQGFDLNKDQEQILHSKNWEFERSISTSDYMLNTGWTGTTDWTGSVDGLAAGITSREDYALEFDGSAEYLGIPLSVDLAVFTPSTISAGSAPTGWTKYGSPTLTYETTESGSSGYMKMIADTVGVTKDSILTVGKKYKIVIRYKSTVNIRFGYTGPTPSTTAYGYFTPTSEWCTTTRIITAGYTGFSIINDTSGTAFIESITVKEDQGFDLNKDQEQILHSKNWDFERTLATTYNSNRVGGFDTGVDGWAASSGASILANIDYSGEADCLKITSILTGTGTAFPWKIIGAVGNRYVVKAKVYIPSTNVEVKGLNINGNGNFYNPENVKYKATELDKWITVEFEEVMIGGNIIRLYLINNAGNNALTASSNGDVVYVKYIQFLQIPNLVTNGTFDSSTGWALEEPATQTIVGGVLKFVNTTTAFSLYSSGTNLILYPNRRYRISFQILNYSAGGIRVSGVGVNSSTFSANGSHSYDFIYTASGGYFAIQAQGTTTLDIDNIHISEIPEWTSSGNHSLLYTTADKYIGTSSLKITATNSGSSTNCVALPSGSFEQCVSGKKYTLEGFAKLDPTSLTYGSELFTAFTGSTIHPYETSSFSGNSIASASNTSDSACVYVSNVGSITNKDIFKLSFNFVKNSGNYPKIVLADDGENISGATSNIYYPVTGSNNLYIVATANRSNSNLLFWQSDAGDWSLSNLSIKKASSVPYITAQLGTKSVNSAILDPSTWTKFVLNFLATSNEVNQDLKLWLTSSGAVYVDSLSLTQAYDMVYTHRVKLAKTGSNGIMGTNAATPNQVGVLTTTTNLRTEIGLTNTNNSEISSAYPIADGYWHNNLFGINKDTYSYATVDSNAITSQSMSTIGKHIMSQPFLVGRVWVGYMKGQLSYLQAYRFENINQSTFLTSSQGLQFPVGGGAEEVLRLTFQDPRSVAGMLKDYSPKNHNVIPSGGIDLTNRVRTYYAITGSSYIPIEDVTNKLFWLNPNKISTAAVDRWTLDYPTGSINYFWNSPGGVAPETSSLNSIGVYTPTGTNYMRLTDAVGSYFIPSGSDWTMFAVMKNTSGPAISKYSGGTNKIFYFAGGSNLRILVRDSSANALDINAVGIDVTGWKVVVTTYDNTSKTLTAYITGSVHTATNASYINDGWEMVGARLFINGQGTGTGTTATSYGTGTGMAEWVITTDKKSSTDINKIAGYLANKYGLTWTNI